MSGSQSPPTGPAGDTRTTPQPAYRSPLAWVLLLGVLIVGLALDISTKYWSFAAVADSPVELNREQLLADRSYNPIPYHDGVRVLPGRLLDFRLVINRGAVFGLGADQRAFFIVFTLTALVVGLVVFSKFTTSRSHLAHVALGLVIAGGVGNLYDRIVYGVVRDFLHMLPGWQLPFGWRWPGNNPEIFPWIFNIADVMLLTGMALLMIHINLSDRRKQQQAQRDSDESTDKKSSDSNTPTSA